MKNVIYIGNLHTVAEYILFNSHYNLIGIICESDRVNDKLLTFSMVRNVPICRVNNDKPISNAINAQSEDVIFIMCSYGRRVPVEKCNGRLIFNIHFAALPNYKGRHPSYWATVSGEQYLGVSIHEVTEQFDRGRIISRHMVPYYIWENEDMIFDKLANETPKLLDELDEFLHGKKTWDIKNSDGGYFRPVTIEDITLRLDNDSPDLLFNKVRSQTRAGGALCICGEKKFRLFEIFFSEKTISADFVIEDKLYIRYKNNICIVSGKYNEE